MKTRILFAKTDLFVLIGCLCILLMNLGLIGRVGRERAKREVCLNNLRQLTQAWIQFADDNNGWLVSGDAGYTHYSVYGEPEPPWVGVCWADDYALGESLPTDVQQSAIVEGTLWPYCRSLNLYRCPAGYPDEMLNYSLVDSMNGRPNYTSSGVFDPADRGPAETIRRLLYKNRSQIKQASQRAVFIDEGWTTPDSFAINYSSEAWWDDPPVRHRNGATLSFADAHCEYWQWKGTETIRIGQGAERGHPHWNYPPETKEGAEDLRRLQIAAWGELGYVP